MTSSASQHAAAEQRAHALIQTIREIGFAKSLQEIATALNARNAPTERGGKWYPASVQRVLTRAGVTAGIDVIEGDCRIVLRTLATGSVNVVVTSPPYL